MPGVPKQVVVEPRSLIRESCWPGQLNSLDCLSGYRRTREKVNSGAGCVGVLEGGHGGNKDYKLV